MYSIGEKPGKGTYCCTKLCLGVLRWMTVQTACHRAAIAAKGKIRPTTAASLQEHRFKGNYIQ